MTLRAAADGRVFAEVLGNSDNLVVFLHGWGRSRTDLRAVGHGIDDARCVYLDLPGFGASPPPDGPSGARDYAAVVGEAIRELADDWPPRRLVLVGHSFGGRVALCVAAQEPNVAGLLLSGVPLLRRGASRPRLSFRLARALHRRGLVSEQAMERRRQRHGSADYRSAQGVMRDVLVQTVAESYDEELSALACPLTLVWGAEDTAAPIDMVRSAEQLVKAPHKLLVLDGVGHDVHRARPEVLSAEIAELCGLAK